MARFKQLAFTFDQSLCTGCKACQIACKDKHDLPVGVTWRRVAEYSGGGWGESDEARPRGEGAGFEPLPDPSTTRPNLVVIPHPKAQKSGTGTGAVGNPAEL